MFSCVYTQFNGRCDFGTDFGLTVSTAEALTLYSVINIGAIDDGPTLSASVAVQLEGFSLVVVAYTIPSSDEHEIGIVSQYSH